jgi:hypothetical protein
MRLVEVSGSWRYELPGLPNAVRREVAAALRAGKGIVTGGALGVDYWATEMALSINRATGHPPYFLATSEAHYRRRATEGISAARHAEDLIGQLEAVAQAGGLVEHPARPQVEDVTTHYRRNRDIVDIEDEPKLILLTDC